MVLSLRIINLIFQKDEFLVFCEKCKNLNPYKFEVEKQHVNNLCYLPTRITEDYNISKFLGKGSFGFVFSVQHKLDKKLYALKLIRVLDGEEYVFESILTEIDNLCSVSHPNIIKYLQSIDCRKEKTHPMIGILMEFADCSLKEKILSLNEEKAIDYSFQICKGLRYLHIEKKMIHRDLKPDNILLAEDKIKICDLGISKKKTRGEEFTTAPDFLGTENYLAPEVILKQDKISCSVDIWAFGIIMHKLLTNGIHPFGSSQGELLKKMVGGDFKISSKITDRIIKEILERRI